MLPSKCVGGGKGKGNVSLGGEKRRGDGSALAEKKRKGGKDLPFSVRRRAEGGESFVEVSLSTTRGRREEEG